MIGAQFLESIWQFIGGVLILLVFLVATVVVAKYAFRYAWRFTMWAIGDELRWVGGGFRAIGRAIASPFRNRDQKDKLREMRSKVEDLEERAMMQQQINELTSKLEELQSKRRPY